MTKTSKYEITFDRKQAFFAMIALIATFFLTFALGVVLGTKSSYFKSAIQNTKVEPSPKDSLPFESFKTTHTKVEEGGNVTQFTFYDTLPKHSELPFIDKTDKANAKGKKKIPITKKVGKTSKTLDQDMVIKGFTIQLGSFKQKEKAYALENKLKKQGYLVHVTPKIIDGKGTWYRVRMGNFSTQEEAQEWVSKLGALSPPPFITSTPD